MRDTSQELKSLRDMAKSASQLSAAISAEVKREELRRFYVQIEPAHVNQLSKMSDGELQRSYGRPMRSLGPWRRASHQQGGTRVRALILHGDQGARAII